MFRYLGFNWNPASATQAALVQQLEEGLLIRPAWQPALRRQGLRAYTAGHEPGINGAYPLPFAQGVVLGRLFRRGTRHDATEGDLELTAGECDRIARTGGRALVDDFWGRYVAIFWSNRCGAQVLRDPSGTLPCHRVRIEDVDLVFSWMEDLMELLPGKLPLRVDWNAAAASLVLSQLAGRDTALQGIGQVVPGELEALGLKNRPSTALWRGSTYAMNPLDINPDAAGQQLREAIVSCTRSWASCYGSLLLRLSGGLDSAILLGSLRLHVSASQITALNYHSEGADSDERMYARVAAARAGVTLVERERDLGFSLEEALRVARTPTPQSYAGRMGASRVDTEVAAAQGALAMFTGGGGDQLLFERRCTWPAADYLKAHGPGPGFFSAALDAAHLGRVSVWHAIRQAFVDAYGRASLPRGTPGLTLLRSDLVDGSFKVERCMCPDVIEAANLPIGKRYHLRDVVTPIGYYDPYLCEAAPELVNPLMSQPVMELCLALPTYLLSLGGRSRGLARHAFRRELPIEIATRRTKGGMNEFATAVLQRNLAFVKALLLDGHLVREGLIDRRRLEAVLSGRLDGIHGYLTEIHNCVAVEAWILSCASAQAR